MGTGATVLGALALGVDIDIAGMIGAVELIVKPLAYYLHERVWYRFIRYGIKKP